jgi:excisionase family DNA binding protein
VTTDAKLAYSRREAAEALGLSLQSFKRHVQPQLRAVYVGRLRLYPRSELERWLARNQGVRPGGRE